MSEHVALPPARHEPQDVSFRYMALGFAGTLCIILLCLLLVMWMFPSIEVDRRLPGQTPVYPEPRLQSDPAVDLQKFLKSERARLNSTGWADREHGIAHIPIDEAMQRIVQQGIADWPRESPR